MFGLRNGLWLKNVQCCINKYISHRSAERTGKIVTFYVTSLISVPLYDGLPVSDSHN